jgi:hypothetical protein
VSTDYVPDTILVSVAVVCFVLMIALLGFWL